MDANGCNWSCRDTTKLDKVRPCILIWCVFGEKWLSFWLAAYAFIMLIDAAPCLMQHDATISIGMSHIQLAWDAPRCPQNLCSNLGSGCRIVELQMQALPHLKHHWEKHKKPWRIRKKTLRDCLKDPKRMPCCTFDLSISGPFNICNWRNSALLGLTTKPGKQTESKWIQMAQIPGIRKAPQNRRL